MNRISIIDEIAPGRVLWLRKTRPGDEPIAYYKAPEKRTKRSLFASSDGRSTSDEIIVPVVDSSEELRKVKIHTVATGESLWAVSRKYDVSMDDLLRWNDLPNPDALSVGQNIQVKAPMAEVLLQKEIDGHTVQPSETLYAISRKYKMTVDELMELNQLTSTDISIGQQLKVYSN